MHPLRAVLMLVAAAIAFYRGFELRHSERGWVAFVLGVLAVGLAVWHLARGARS